jgi:hypothetical protein
MPATSDAVPLLGKLFASHYVLLVRMLFDSMCVCRSSRVRGQYHALPLRNGTEKRESI